MIQSKRKLLQKGNSKLSKDGIYSWSLPAVKSCPMAGTCKIGCYATQGTFNFPNVKKAYALNFALAKNHDRFYNSMQKEISKLKHKSIIRIHASGDFFNKSYFYNWYSLANDFPNVQFYAYSKMVLMIKEFKQDLIMLGKHWPDNLTIIFSEGGKQDSMISENNDRHARVFNSISELKKAGYANVTEHDIGAMGNNHKIGLVYHGAESKKWSTQ